MLEMTYQKRGYAIANISPRKVNKLIRKNMLLSRNLTYQSDDPGDECRLRFTFRNYSKNLRKSERYELNHAVLHPHLHWRAAVGA